MGTYTTLAGCILPQLSACCLDWMHSTWPAGNWHSAAPNTFGRRPQNACPSAPPGRATQTLRAWRPNASRAIGCFQARSNASCRGSMHSAKAVCIQPRQYATRPSRTNPVEPECIHLKPISFCLLPFANCPLPIANCPLPIAYCLLPIA